MKTLLRWAGHVTRMNDYRLPKIVLFGELSSGHRNVGAPKKRYKDQLKKSLKTCNIDPDQFSHLATNRNAWRTTISRAASSFETSRREKLKEKRHQRKNKANTLMVPAQVFPCSRCNKECLSKIGLISHQRACSRREVPP